MPVSLAWDGDTLYWVGETGSSAAATNGTVCELVRSRDVAFTPIKGGEVGPPIEVYVDS